jgi:hypothetical protein
MGYGAEEILNKIQTVSHLYPHSCGCILLHACVYVHMPGYVHVVMRPCLHGRVSTFSYKNVTHAGYGYVLWATEHTLIMHYGPVCRKSLCTVG